MTGKHAKQNRTQAKFTAMGLAALVGLTGVISASSAPIVGETEAVWTDSEHVASRPLTADEVQPPQEVGCEPGGLLTPPTIEWQHPSSGPPREGYIFEVRESGILGPNGLVTTYEIDDPDATSQTLNRGLFDLLGDLLQLGQSYSVTLRTQGPGEWTSDASEPTGFRRTLGLITTCAT